MTKIVNEQPGVGGMASISGFKSYGISLSEVLFARQTFLGG